MLVMTNLLSMKGIIVCCSQWRPVCCTD